MPLPSYDTYIFSFPAGRMTPKCATAPVAIEKLKWVPASTNAEDVIGVRAFIAASEDAMFSAHQKGKVLKLHVFELCKNMLNEGNRANKVRRTIWRKRANMPFPHPKVNPPIQISDPDECSKNEVHGDYWFGRNRIWLEHTSWPQDE